MKRYTVILKSEVHDSITGNDNANTSLSDSDRTMLINFNHTLFNNTQEELVDGLFINEGMPGIIIPQVDNNRSNFDDRIVINVTTDISYDELYSIVSSSLSDGWGENDKPFGQVLPKIIIGDTSQFISEEDIQTDEYYYYRPPGELPPIKSIEDKYGKENLKLIQLRSMRKSYFLDERNIDFFGDEYTFSDTNEALTEDEISQVKSYDSYYIIKRECPRKVRAKLFDELVKDSLCKKFYKKEGTSEFYKDTNSSVYRGTRYSVIYTLESITEIKDPPIRRGRKSTRRTRNKKQSKSRSKSRSKSKSKSKSKKKK